MCHVSTIIFNFQLSIFNSIETHQSHRVYFHRCNWYVSTIIFNFQLSIFNSIETHQSHRVYFHWCNVSRLYHNFQFSIFDFQFSIRLRRTNYIVFIFIGVMCHVSTIIFNFQLSIFNFLEPYSDICYSFQLWFSHRLFYLKMISAIKRETQIVV